MGNISCLTFSACKGNEMKAGLQDIVKQLMVLKENLNREYFRTPSGSTTESKTIN
jgi:hypothetical protein